MFSHAKRIRIACDTIKTRLEKKGVLDEETALLLGFIRGAAYVYQTDEEKGLTKKRHPDGDGFTDGAGDQAMDSPWGISYSKEMQPND